MPGDWVVTELNRVAVEDYRVFRFWIASTPESELRIADFGEALDGVRLSVQMNAIVSPDARIGKGSLAFTRSVRAANALIVEGDIDGAQREITRLVKWSVADSLLPLKLVFPIKLQWMQANWTQVLALLDDWDSGMPRPAILEYMAMDAHVALGNHEQAWQAAERFMQAVGPHPDAYEVMGWARSWQGRMRECMQAWDASLKIDSNHMTSLLYMAGLAEAEDEELLLRHLRGFGPLAEYFDNFGRDLIDRKCWSTLEMFCGELKVRDPENPNSIYYTACRLIEEGRSPRKAFSMLLEVLPRTGDESDSYFELLLSACAQVEQLEGQPAWSWIYDKLPEHQQATFEFFAERMAWKDLDGLMAWADKHSQRHAGHHELKYYLAVIAEMRESYREAAFQYAKALSVWPADEEDDLELILGRQVECLLLDGNLEYAFHKARPRNMAWEWILDFCYQQDRVDLLEQALDLRLMEEPKDLELSLWRGFGAWMVDDYALASTAFAGADLWCSRFIDKGYQYNFFHYAVRSHIRAEELDKALELGMKITELEGDPYFEALARTALWQDKRAQKLFLGCLQSGWNPDDLRGDYDLESHFLRPGFSELRVLLEQD